MRQLLIALLLWAPAAFALDINEELANVRVLAVYPGNVVVLNRGLEDGVMIGTHAKLRGTDGYAGRGVCLKAGMLTSHWRIYRVVSTEVISKDLTYRLVGMDASEAPHDMNLVRDTNKPDKLPDFDESHLSAVPLAVDLPADLSKDDAVLEKKKGPTKVFVQKNFDKKLLKEDFKRVAGSLYASPWSAQKGPTNQETVRVGASISNEGTKYQFAFGINHAVLRASQSKTNDSINTRQTNAVAVFTIKDLSPSWDALSEVNYRQAVYGGDDAPKGQYLISPVGFSWRAPETKTRPQFELSYAPTYDTRTHEGLRADGSLYSGSDSGLRHSFSWYWEQQISSAVTLSNAIRWRPRQDLSTWALDTADNLTQERFAIKVHIVNAWNLDYVFEWMDDAQLRRMSGLPRVTTINSVNLRYDFSL